jgi:hypothetical protein
MSTSVQASGALLGEDARQQQYLTGLRQVLDGRFGVGELRTFCFDLGIDYDDLPGESKADKARELVSYVERHGRLSDLVALGKARRPDIPWGDPSAAVSTTRIAEIAFVDREGELSLLNPDRLRASRSPYTLISAPAGYGKSSLLQYLANTVESDESLREKWCVRYMDLGLMAAQDPEGQVAHIAHAIAGSPSLRASDPPVVPSQQVGKGGDSAGGSTARETSVPQFVEMILPVDEVVRAVVQDLSTPLPEGRRAVLLIFDAVERLGEGSQKWLYALLNDLRRRSHLGAQEIIVVRVIIAGRSVERFWEGYEQAYPKQAVPQRILLARFDAHPVRELIWNRARAAHVELDGQIVHQIAVEIQYLSGGHPAVICSLVDDLAGQSFAIGPVEEYFTRCRQQLVRTCLASVAHSLLKSLENDLDAQGRRAVQVLSIFRQVNANTVQVLVAEGALGPEINEIDLLGDMQTANLLEGPSIRTPFYRNHSTRSIWALDMAYGSPENAALYQRLNKVALGLYRGWIHNLGQGLPDTPLKAMQRMLSVVEWLFHALQDSDLDEDGLRSELQAHVAVLSEDDQLSLIADLIADEIKKDTEVHYLIRRRLGRDGVSTVCSWLQSL